MTVSRPCKAWRDALPDAARRGRAAARAAFQLGEGVSRTGGRPAEAGLVLGDDAAVQALNRDYRGIDRPTNVLSFALLDGTDAADLGPVDAPAMLGDMVLAFETIAAEAARDGKALGDHFSHLVVHAMLHLLGLDHGTAAEADRMERLEAAVLARLGIADPYCDAQSPVTGQ